MYEILLTDRAVKDLGKLPEKVQHHIGVKLREYSRQPLLYARKLTNPALGTYRFRIGTYRVVFDIEGLKIVVLRIGHRKDIYR